MCSKIQVKLKKIIKRTMISNLLAYPCPAFRLVVTTPGWKTTQGAGLRSTTKDLLCVLLPNLCPTDHHGRQQDRALTKGVLHVKVSGLYAACACAWKLRHGVEAAWSVGITKHLVQLAAAEMQHSVTASAKERVAGCALKVFFQISQNPTVVCLPASTEPCHTSLQSLYKHHSDTTGHCYMVYT